MILRTVTLSALLATTFIGTASAHVKVSPATAGVAAYQEFTVSVPVERDIPTTGIRLVIPSGLEYVTPNMKPGWTITTKKDGDVVSEITWSKGQIIPGLRDTFVFSAKTPATQGSLMWKAYQTYQDGTVVAWDADPNGIEESDTKGPYSVTAIEDDLTQSDGGSSKGMSVAALALATISLVLAGKRSRKEV